MKIAICFSGQTRDYELYKDKILDDIDQLFGDHVYDLYGHTWTDCEVPSNIDDFKKFVQTDQNEISKWVKEDITTFGTFYNSWNDYPEYVDIINGNGDYFQFICKMSKGRLGQTVSAHKCFSLVPPNVYDIIVRYRWDILINPDIYMYGKDRAIDDFKVALSHFKHVGYDIAVPTHLRYCLGAAGNVTIPDLFFIMTKECHSYVYNMDIKKIHRSINQVNLSAHSLWGEVLAHYASRKDGVMGKIVSMLPYLWEAAGYRGEKENHKWNI